MAGRKWRTDQSLKEIALKSFVKLADIYVQVDVHSYDF